MTIDASDLWTAGGILLGFQVASFMWRIEHEVSVAGQGRVSWLPAADIVNLLGMLALAIGVFVGPIAGFVEPRTQTIAFGLAALLFVGHCFAVAGHYELYNNTTGRSFRYCPFQEKVVMAVLAAAVACYLAASC